VQDARALRHAGLQHPDFVGNESGSIGVDDAYSVRVNESLAIGTPGILGNDADANGAVAPG
jgi:hypothetical protein